MSVRLGIRGPEVQYACSKASDVNMGITVNFVQFVKTLLLDYSVGNPAKPGSLQITSYLLIRRMMKIPARPRTISIPQIIRITSKLSENTIIFGKYDSEFSYRSVFEFRENYNNFKSFIF